MVYKIHYEKIIKIMQYNNIFKKYSIQWKAKTIYNTM